MEQVNHFYDLFNTPSHVKGHCKEVTRVAMTIAKALNHCGYNLDTELIFGAGMCHDLARTSREHWNVGADFLVEKGYLQESEIVRAHMSHHFNPVDKLNETDMICLGDRLVCENAYVGIDKRFQYIMDKAPKRPGVKEHLIEQRELMRNLLRQIEQRIGVEIDALCTGD